MFPAWLCSGATANIIIWRWSVRKPINRLQFNMPDENDMHILIPYYVYIYIISKIFYKIQLVLVYCTHLPRWLLSIMLLPLCSETSIEYLTVRHWLMAISPGSFIILYTISAQRHARIPYARAYLVLWSGLEESQWKFRYSLFSRILEMLCQDLFWINQSSYPTQLLISKYISYEWGMSLRWS